MDVWCVCMHAASTYTLGVLSHAKSSGTWAPRLSELWDLSAFPSWEQLLVVLSLDSGLAASTVLQAQALLLPNVDFKSKLQ